MSPGQASACRESTCKGSACHVAVHPGCSAAVSPPQATGQHHLIAAASDREAPLQPGSAGSWVREQPGGLRRVGRWQLDPDVGRTVVGAGAAASQPAHMRTVKGPGSFGPSPLRWTTCLPNQPLQKKRSLRRNHHETRSMAARSPLANAPLARPTLASRNRGVCPPDKALPLAAELQAPAQVQQRPERDPRTVDRLTSWRHSHLG
jgi:hypothetical protein